MLRFLTGHYGYWFTLILLTIGLYGMIFKRNLVKKLIGMTIFQVSIIMFYLTCAAKFGGTVPVLIDDSGPAAVNPAAYINALPHTLMLTAIVVGVATTGVAFAIVITIYKRYKTLDEDVLLERMKKDHDEPAD